MSNDSFTHRASRTFEDLSHPERAGLTSAIVADSLDAVGFRDQVVDEVLTGLTPNDRLFGRASTIRFAPTEDDSEDPYGDAVRFIDGLQRGEVAVVATGGDRRTAYWGELFSAAALGRGAVGTICDGPVRDASKVIALSYPTFSAGCRPIDYRARMRVVDQHRPVQLGGVVIRQGDLVLADLDGVVVVPHGVETEVLGSAVRRASDEGKVLGALRAGARLAEVWQRWGVL